MTEKNLSEEATVDKCLAAYKQHPSFRVNKPGPLHKWLRFLYKRNSDAYRATVKSLTGTALAVGAISSSFIAASAGGIGKYISPSGPRGPRCPSGSRITQ